MTGTSRAAGPPVARRARSWPHRDAVRASGRTRSFGDLLRASAGMARRLLTPAAEGEARIADLDEARVAYLTPPGFGAVAASWGIWRAGGIAVPLAVSHPPRELARVLDDADPVRILADPSLADRLEPLAAERDLPLEPIDPDREARDAPGGPDAGLPSVEEERGAFMLYTSGTTGRPKGVVHTHRSLRAQMESLVRAWEWHADDRILLVLPLHHVHGLVNVLGCALWSGARCDVLPRFDAGETWTRIGEGELTLFMGVPTIYHRLIAAWEAAGPATRERWSEGARQLRLTVSGSAALPVPVLERWREITGHTLLERYGMTEIGMALSNPLHGERRPGHIGRPLPGVEVRLVDDAERPVEREGVEGEIQVRGPNLFREYWRRPEATREAFTGDGWFRTGDLAVVEDGHFRILGRRSVDIINTGGHLVSALEVEDVLRRHDAVDECAVVGVPDPEWGERVAAAVVPRAGADLEELGTAELRAWAKERLAPYKAPTLARTVESLPRNAMGKVTKPDVRALFRDGGE